MSAPGKLEDDAPDQIFIDIFSDTVGGPHEFVSSNERLHARKKNATDINI